MIETAAIYEGHVVHKRLRPRLHSLTYKVYALLLDVDRIAQTSAAVRLFSYNKPNLCSLYDRDFALGDGTPIADQARRLFEAGGFSTAGGRILLLAYPRNMGYAFNPLSVYFLVDHEGSLKALMHEVTNTFGERKSYVVPASERGTGGIHAQSCRKELFVSPFAEKSGRYHFRVREPGEAVTVGVAYDDGHGPLIKTHFFGAYSVFSDRNLASVLIRQPLMTFKVTGAIHFEAFKLWLKGVPLVRGNTSPRYSVSYVRTSDRHLRAQRDLIEGN